MSCGNGSSGSAKSGPIEASAQTLVGTPGFYRLASEDGVWWFVTPENKRFFSIGVNHIDPNLLLTEVDSEAAIAKYGADLRDDKNRANGNGVAAHKFMEESMDNIQKWGFNSLGGQNQVPQTRMPYIATFRPAIIENWPGIKKNFPDPFAKATEKMVDKKAMEWAATRKDDPLIMGVTTTAMPLWASRPDKIHPWVRAIMNLGPKAPGKVEWMKMLRNNYPSPAAVGTAYGVKAKSWTDLASRTKWPKPADPARVQANQDDMLERIAARWYPLVTKSVRTHMPNHLFLGDKIVPFRDLPEWLVPIVGANFDIMYFQWYDHSDAQMERLNKIYRQTGKPIIMGDSSFAHPNERVPEPKGVPVESQAAVGTTYADYMATMAARPWFIGWHHCGYMEGSPDLKRIGPLIARQNGFIKPDGTIYAKTIDAVKAANKAAYGQHMDAQSDFVEKAPAEQTRSEPDAPLMCTQTANESYRINQVGDQVFELRMASKHGSPGKPVTWIIGTKGVLVYDTGSAPAGMTAHKVIREMTDLPILYVVYSHHHGTQLTGAPHIIEDDTTIIAHEDLVNELRITEELDEHFSRVNSIQFNQPRKIKSPALFPQVTYTGTIEIDLGGVVLELRHMVGEAEGYTVLWWPRERMVWMADLLPGGMPMVASPMKEVRNEVKWLKSLQTIRDLQPRALFYTGHDAVCDTGEITALLDIYIDFLDFLHEAVVVEINKGSTAEEAVANIQLPARLQNQKALIERYGTLEFAVRGLHHKYSGWFDQNGSNILPAPAKVLAAAMVDDMGGRDAVLARARALNAAGKHKIATEYADLLIRAGKDPEALAIKAQALDSLADKFKGTNRIVKHMLRRTAIDTRNKAKQMRGPQ